MAKATNECITSRRKFLVGASVAALLGPGTAIAEAADLELMRLAERYAAEKARSDELYEHFLIIEEEYAERKPVRPKALRWKISDPCGYKHGGGRDFFCDEKDIEKMRTGGLRVWEFKGSSEEYDALPPEHFDPWQGPTPEYARLYEVRPEPSWQTKRKAEIIAAYDEWTTEIASLKDSIRYETALDLHDEALNRSMDTFDEVAASVPTSIQGIKAKAEVYAHRFFDGLLPSGEDFDDHDCDARSLITILRDIQTI